ncbi:hypothetical protein [Bacillus sp. X1(2014)]|uniref:hypothetical protein n=1 Tax=Bacillus sp. X1(2014) TaxID=1565991 RepID=UPI0011AAE98B|nr:hypothetical protein [Bacillus sp. X1(2014)]
MIWFLLLIVLFAFMMGFFQVPIWIMYSILVVVLILILFRNPLLFGKDAEKIMAYLKKSKELLREMGGHKTKWYALSDIAINEGDVEAFKQYKAKITDTFFLNMLEVDQAVYDGKKDEAVGLLDSMIPKLRGYKFLTAVQYRKHILEGRV